MHKIQAIYKYNSILNGLLNCLKLTTYDFETYIQELLKQ